MLFRLSRGEMDGCGYCCFFAVAAVVVVVVDVVVFEKTLSRFHKNIGPRHFYLLQQIFKDHKKEITEVQNDKKILVKIFR